MICFIIVITGIFITYVQKTSLNLFYCFQIRFHYFYDQSNGITSRPLNCWLFFAFIPIPVNLLRFCISTFFIVVVVLCLLIFSYQCFDQRGHKIDIFPKF
jgi:hypothetical protein